jgi:hypothetical protein
MWTGLHILTRQCHIIVPSAHCTTEVTRDIATSIYTYVFLSATWSAVTYKYMYVKASLFWDFTQSRIVVLYRRRDNLSTQSSRVKQPKYPSSGIARPSKKGPISCPETSVRNYHCMLRKMSQERNFIYTATQAWNLKYVRVSECHLGQCHRYVLVDQCRLRHQHVIKCFSVLVFYQRYAGATNCQMVHHHVVYPSAHL